VNATITDDARKVARVLDSVFRVPGTRFRFGLDPIIGLVPGLGDAVAGGFGVYLLVLALRSGAPPIVLFRMFANIGLDLLFGTVPLLGDLLDAGYKANLRNLDLLDRYLDRPQETSRKSLAIFVALLAILVLLIVGAIWLAVAAIRAIL
jgi:hypothetical protein